MRIAALVEAVTGPDGPEMEALSRRAVAQATELAAAVGDGTCTAIVVGPDAAAGLLREAISWARSYSVVADGVRVASDTAPTPELYADVVERAGPFDLVLLGAEPADDGPPMGRRIADRLELPYAGPARYLSMQGRTLHVRCEEDDGFVQVKVPVPAVISCARALIDPCEVAPTARALVSSELIRVIDADDLG
jgi:electron transfer flavoprotein alpha/beta subunit